MEGELHLEIGGYRISVAKASPKAASPSPAVPAPSVASSSSFELVDLPQTPRAAYSSATADPPYPLQASAPGVALDLGSSAASQLSPVRPLVCLTSPQPGVSEYPLQPSGPVQRVASPQVPVSSSGSQVRPVAKSSLPLPPCLPEYPLQGPLRPRSEVRDSFPPLPAELLNTCRSLRGGSVSWQQRALRAWEAGCWARAVLLAEVETPNSLQPLGLSNRFYCVLVAVGQPGPCVLRSFGEYRAVVGHLQRGGSLSHAFPSESESRLYFAGAGVPYPSS